MTKGKAEWKKWTFSERVTLEDQKWEGESYKKRYQYFSLLIRSLIEKNASDGCPGIEREGRFQRRKANQGVPQKIFQ